MKRNIWWNKNIRLADLAEASKFMIGLFRSYMRVSMGLTDSRKTAKNLVDSRENWKILTVSRK